MASLLSGMAPAMAAPDTPTGGEPGTRAFVLSNVYLATPHEEGVCAELSHGAPETFLKSLPTEQQQRYSTPDKHEQLFGLMHQKLGFKWFVMLPRSASGKENGARAPGWPTLLIDADPATVRIEDVRAQAGIPEGKGAIVFNHSVVAYDSCTNPEDFPTLDQGFRPYDGTLAYGIDLGGKNKKAKFLSPNGDKNVDNQLWRAIGCMKHFREFGDPENADNTLFSAAAPPLIEITGVDDWRNDKKVDVAIYTSVDPLQADARGRPLANASYTTDPRTSLISRTHGKISNGILTTEPFDLRLRYKEQIIDATRDLRGVRIRATLKPDGSIDGGFYGYYVLDSYYDSIRQMSQPGANLSSLSCPAIHTAIHRYADGYPDPATGQNTAISAALNFVGVSAFAIHADAPSTIISSNR